MQRTKSKILSILLSLVMLLSLLPTTALAAYPDASNVYVDGDKRFYNSTRLYYKNVDSDGSFTGTPTDFNAAYDPATGTLTLKDYNGKGITVGGVGRTDITVKLVGTNIINDGSLENAVGGDITVTSSDGGTLSISETTSGSNPAIGIETGLSGSYTTGNVTIKGDAEVTIDMTHNGTSTYEKAYGIFAKENITISENASVNITCATPNNTTGGSNCNGMFANGNVSIDTTGKIKIDVTKAGKDDAYSFGIYSMETPTLTRVGEMQVQWKKHSTHSSYPGGAISREASFDTTTHAVNVDTINCYASYRFGTPRKVTAQNGQLTGPGVKYENGSGYFLAGDKVNITPAIKKSWDDQEIPFKEWTSSDVTLDKSATTASNSFTVPDKDVTVTAKHSPFVGTPKFTPTGTTGTQGTLTFKTVVKANAAQEGFRLVEEGNENNESSYISIRSDTTSTSSPYEYSYETSIYGLNEGNYYVVAYLNNHYYLGEKVTVSYTPAPTPTANISLDTTGTVDFGSKEESYTTAPAAQTVTITNNGTAATGALTIALEGTSATNFTLSKTSITDIAASGTDTFTVQPKTGLSAGIYTATVKVSGTGVTEQSFDVKFTVTAPLTAIAVPTPNSVTYDGTKQTGVNAGMGYTLGGDYEATDVGAADYVATATLDTGYKWNDGSTDPVTITWNIGKRDPKIEDFEITLPTDLTKNYTGSPITVAAPTLKSGRTGAGTITVKYADSTTAPTNAGTYTVTFDVAEGQNYTAATGLSIGTLTINKVSYTGAKTASATVRSGQTTANATLTLPALPAGASYGTVTVTTDTSSLINGTPTVSGNTLTYSTNSKDDSTSATLTIPVTGATNYNDYSVTVTVTAKDKNPAEVTLGTVPTSKTYGDANFTVTASAAHTEAGGTWTWTSSNESVLKVTGTSTTGTVQVVGQGNATITAKYESANYLGSATSGTIAVNKKNVTITGLSAQNKVYDGNTTATVNGTAVVSGKVGSDDVTVTAGSAAFANKRVGNNKTVTFSGYSLSGTAAGNYNLTAQPASVTANITAKPVTVTVTATDRDYVSGNRNVVLVAGSVTGTVVGDTVNVDVSGATGTMENEDAGTGKAVTVTGVALSGTDAGNYNLTAQPTGVTVTINKKNYDGSITGNKNVHTNQAQTGVTFDMSEKFGVIKGAAVKSVSEGTDSDNLIDNVSFDGNVVKFDVASIADAGKTATINVVISCTNFNDITAVLTVKTVDKDEAGVTISGVPTAAKTYGDADFTLTASAATPGANGAWTWETSDSSVLQLTPNGNKVTVKILKVGKATVTAKYESDTTIGQLTTANIRVEKATITVTAKNQSIYVNGTVPDLSSPVKDTHYTVTGLASGDTLGGTLTMKYQKDGVDATPDATKTGTYDIVISGATAPAGGNYNDVVFTAGTLTISNRPSSGGGGGGGSSGSSGSTITVPVSDPKNQVKVTVTVSGTTATVQKIDLSKIDQAQGVTIDFTGLGRTIESAKLPTSAIKESGATESGALTVKLTAGNVTFDNAALKAVADQAGSQITLTLAPVKTSTLNASQKEAVGDAPVFDLQLLSGSKAITDFKGGNVTVTLPHTLSKGQEPAGVVVYYLSNDGNPEACKTTYDAKSKLVTFTTTHFSLYFVGYKQPAAEWENPFTDVAEGAWYYDSIKYVYSNGMMVGTGDTKFSPDTTTTRGMIVTILYRLEGEPAVSGTSSFNDVASGRWYANAVKWAAENEIVGGYGNGNFGPEDPISREQMAAILYRYAAFKGFDMTKTADLSKFTDSGKISDWAKAALSWANAEGLINGKGGGILDPLGKATRAEIATILRNFCENVVK